MSDKSLLAKLLATENITVQKTPGIKTAMFDLKNRVLMLPIWQGISNDLEDLLIVHETGHALDTPKAETYKKAAEDIASRIFPNEKISERLASTIRGFLNVIEDARIDKRQKRRYPGSRKNYLIGYKELMDRDFFGTAKRDINTMNFIDRLNVYFKGGSIHHNITFNSEEKVFIKKVENAETFAQVVSLTEEIYLYCKNKLEQMNEMENDLLLEEGEAEDDDGNDGDDFNGNDFDDDDGESESTKNEEGTGEGDEKQEPVATQGEGDIQPETGKDGNPANGLPENAPVSQTEETWQEKSQEIVKSEDSLFIYVTQPEVNWDKALNDYKKVLSDWRDIANGTAPSNRWYAFDKYHFAQCRKDFMQWKVKEKDSISFMVKEFEQKKAAEMYARISIAKTGTIDTNKIHSYKFNEDIFRRISTIPEGKNHGFMMFLDWSGSMSTNLLHTLKQLFSLVLFCKQIGVPFEVYAFKDSECESPFTYINKENVIGCGALVLRNFISSRMTLEELNFAMTMLWYTSDRYHGLSTDSMGGTPLNEAIMIAPKMVQEFTARNKLEITNVIWLTDGGSNPSCGIKNPTDTTDSRIRNRKHFYVDPVTRKTYDYHPYGWGGSSNNTDTFLRILKERTGCNLVGFFLYEYNFKRLDREFDISGYNTEMHIKARKYWNENKFYPVKSAGYDEYYIIDTRSLANTKNELEIDNSGNKKMTIKKMTSAFSKFASKKTVNRVLLRNFVERIAGHGKKVAK